MTFNEIINAKIDEQQKMVDLAEKEGRVLTDEEKGQFNALQEEIASIKNLIELKNGMEQKTNEVKGVLVGEEEQDAEAEEKIATAAYKNAWLKAMQGKRLSAPENAIVAEVNANPQNAAYQEGGLFVPTTIANNIFSLIEEKHPLISDVTVMHVKGNFTMNVHTGITSGDADVVPVGTCLTAEKNAFATVTLGGFQYGKMVEIPWAMRAMSLDVYESYLTTELAKRLGAVIARDMVKAPFSASATRITGIDAFLQDKLASQIAEYTDQVGYKDLTGRLALIGKVEGSASIYVNEATYWAQMANMLDTTGRPIFIADPATGNIVSTFGVPVKVESSLLDGEILFGKPVNGYILNWNQDISVVSQDEAKCLKTNIVGWAVVDGAPTTEYAWSMLKKATA